MKIGLIVEGSSDKDFFDDYFKNRFGFTKNMKVLPSGTDGKCKIMEEKTIKKLINDLRDKNCGEVYILVDLDSKCKKEVYDCEVELKNDYISKMKLLKEKDVNVVVVSSEIEAWMMSAWKKSDKATKEELKRLFKLESSSKLEKQLFQKFISSKKDIDHKNNRSLCHFMHKLSLVEKCK